MPPEIKSSLVSLRRRIRKIQILRGLLRVAAVCLGGLLVIIALDYLLAPLPSLVRTGFFFIWIAAMIVAFSVFLLVPLLTKLPLIRLARWLEGRHPETEERISTAIELSSQGDGISPQLLADLSKDAVHDLDQVDFRKEVQSTRVLRALVPVGGALLVLLSLFALWPREMERLLTRAVLPFSDLGNAGAFRFSIDPGDVEVLEGDELTITLSYTGTLDRPLEFLMEKDGELVSEALQPLRSEGDRHDYSYTIHAAEEDFRYSARVAKSESDRHEAKVYSLPRLIEPLVTLQYPSYTGWPDREQSLGPSISALAGTEVTVKGRFDTPIESGRFLLDEEELGVISFESSARGTEMTWRGPLVPRLDALATVQLVHGLGRELKGPQFHLIAEEDPAPKVKILTPVERQFRVKPDDQIIITYETVERIGLAKTEIELEVNGKRVASLPDFLPIRVDGERGKLWEGEAVIFLGTLLEEHQGAKKFRIRLALSDTRPPELEGPGVGHSEWLEFQLDGRADSLVSQELKQQGEDIRETAEKAIRDLQKAKQKMHQAMGDLHKEEVSERAEKLLKESRKELTEAEKKLAELAERMKHGIHDQHRDKVEKAAEKIASAEDSVEQIPLQDSPKVRNEEMDTALAKSEEAIRDLYELRNEIAKERAKVNDLAKLQELAQAQEALARDALEKNSEKEWQQKQARLEEEVRRKVKDSPEAKAAVMASQSEQAKAFAKEAEELQKSQNELSETNEETFAETLQKGLAREQEAVVEAAKKELAKAREAQADRGNDLPEAIAKAEKALSEIEAGKAQTAAEAAQQAGAELKKGSEESPSQKSLEEKQGEIAEALEDLAEGDEKSALAALEEMQMKRAQKLSEEMGALAALEGNPLRQAEQKVKQGAQKAKQASQSQQADRASQAAQQHQEAAQKFGEAKQDLEQAAAQLGQRAQELAGEAENDQKAPAPGQKMAEALEESSKATESSKIGDREEAAKHAEAAAKALRQAADEAKARMKQGDQPGEPNDSGMEGEANEEAGEKPSEGDADEKFREKEDDQGIPPELAKLGVSSSDWEKIKAAMSREVGGARRSLVPEDYRGLVRDYFEQITKER